MRRILLSSLFLSILGLSGCAMQETAGPVADVAGATIQGVVHGGQQAVVGATVAVYSMTGNGYGAAVVKLASTTTDANGSFAFGGTGTSYSCPYGTTPLYIAATGSSTSSPANSNLVLAAALGPCSTAQSEVVSINEVTTAAFAFAYAQFLSPSLGAAYEPMAVGGTCTACAAGTYNRGLTHAWYAYNQLVTNATGLANTGSTSGSLTIKTESAKLYSVANVLASCVNSTGETSTVEAGTNCGKLFTDVNAKSASPRAYDTLQAAMEIALYPYYNVTTVYGLALPSSPFMGGTTPNDWTMAVSYTSSTLGLGIAQNTMSNLDIDVSGNVWFPSNASGAIGVASFTPSTGTFSTVATASGMVYPQYIAIDTAVPAYAWVSDIGTAIVLGASTTSSTTTKIAGPSGFTAGGPIADFYGNTLVVAGNLGGWTPFVISSARSAATNPSYGYFTASPNGITQDLPADTSAEVTSQTNGGCSLSYLYNDDNDSADAFAGDTSCIVGGIVLANSPVYTDNFMTTSEGQICEYQNGDCTAVTGMHNARGIALDGSSNLWMANAGNSSILEGVVNFTTLNNAGTLTVTPVGSGYLHGSSYGSTMTTPYGIAVDGSGNVWVSNASCVATTTVRCAASGFTLTEVIGVAVPEITPYAAQVIVTNARPTN